jgi:hopanoid biosynthesis associated protein HpnK
LSTASLMVGAPAAADAVARARFLPELRVGLHLVLVDGCPVSPPAEVTALVGGNGEFDRNLARAGVRFFFLPKVRRQLAREIRAQFEAFRATGLTLDHVNAHKHMHLHPSVAGLIVEIGRDYGMKAVRIPAEPVEALRRAFPQERYPTPLYQLWVERLRRRLIQGGMHVLPDGVSEIYFHPATRRTSLLVAAMPGYRHTDELAALLSPAVRERIAALDIDLFTYGDLPA